MTRKWLFLAAAVLVLNASLWLASGALSGIGDYFFGSKMVRAEVVLIDGGAVHDYRIDRGRIRAIAPGSLTLREKDGTVVTIAVASTAQITIGGRLVTFDRLRPGM